MCSSDLVDAVVGAAFFVSDDEVAVGGDFGAGPGTVAARLSAGYHRATHYFKWADSVWHYFISLRSSSSASCPSRWALARPPLMLTSRRRMAPTWVSMAPLILPKDGSAGQRQP